MSSPFTKPFKWRLLKDHKIVYEQISCPLFVQFLMRELKPANNWTIEEIEPKPKEPIEVECQACGEINVVEINGDYYE